MSYSAGPSYKVKHHPKYDGTAREQFYEWATLVDLKLATREFSAANEADKMNYKFMCASNVWLD